MVNVEFCAKLRAAIQEDLESLDMGSWGSQYACRTTLCLAGHAAVTVAGDKPAWHVYSDHNGKVVERRMYAVIPVGEVYEESVSGRAQELMGLTWEQGDALFYTTNEVALKILDWIIEHEEFPDEDTLQEIEYEDEDY